MSFFFLTAHRLCCLFLSFGRSPKLMRWYETMDPLTWICGIGLFPLNGLIHYAVNNSEDSNTTIQILNSDIYRYYFPNACIYFSSNVITFQAPLQHIWNLTESHEIFLTSWSRSDRTSLTPTLSYDIDVSHKCGHSWHDSPGKKKLIMENFTKWTFFWQVTPIIPLQHSVNTTFSIWCLKKLFRIYRSLLAI